MKSKSNESKNYLLTKTELATVLNISLPTITNWKTSRDFEICMDGDKVNLGKTARWLYKWKCEEEKDQDEDEGLKAIKLKTAIINYRKLIEELVPKGEYLQTEKERFNIIRQSILNIPDQLAPDLNLNPAQKELVSNICRSIIQNLKQTFQGRENDWIDFINSHIEKKESDIQE